MRRSMLRRGLVAIALLVMLGAGVVGLSGPMGAKVLDWAAKLSPVVALLVTSGWTPNPMGR